MNNWMGWNFGYKGGASHGTNRAAGRHTSVYVEVTEIVDKNGDGTGTYNADIMVYNVASNSVIARDKTQGSLESIRERATNLYNREEGTASRAEQARARESGERGNKSNIKGQSRGSYEPDPDAQNW